MTSQLTWMGEVWNVADRAAGGPFVNSFASSQVSVDGSGFLHLRVDPDGSGGSIGAELSSVLEGRGYGTYKIEVGSQISGIHPNVVFGGMFTYGTDAAYGHREIDACEQSAWSGATGPWTLGHVVWMPSSASDSYAPRGGFDAADVVTLTDTTQTTILIWEPTRITIRTYRGLSTDPANLYRESVVTEDQTVTFDIEGGGSYTGPATIPVPSDERVHFNLWVAPNFSGTSDPATVTPTDIIIRSFRYTAPSEWAPTTQPPESTASSWSARTLIPNEGLTWTARWLNAYGEGVYGEGLYGAVTGEPNADLDIPSWFPRTSIPDEGLTWAPHTPTGETSLWVGSALWFGTALWP